MATNFTGPITTGTPTGLPTTDTTSSVPQVLIVRLDQGNSRKIVTIPPKSTITMLEATPVSAFTGTDPVSAMTVSFGSSADVTQYGVIQVSALAQTRRVVTVSAATDFESGGTMAVALSALSTTVFTGGGVRAFIHYIQVD